MKKFWLIFVAVVLTLLGCYFLIFHNSEEGDVSDSRFPGRMFRYRTLENGTQVLLIEDSRFENTLVSASFKTGSIDNDSVFGLAHLVEHMVFLGNKQYPGTDAFSKYVQSHGGTYNAYTADQVTNYFFNINADFLDDALDRFVPMLFEPTFQSQTSDEVKAVNSEHMMRVSSGFAQQDYLMRKTFFGDAPRGGFWTGNTESLNEVTSDQLIQFHQQHYHPENMAWVMISPRTLDEQEKMVRSWFSSKNKSFEAFKESRLENPKQRPSLVVPYDQDQIRLEYLKTKAHGKVLSVQLVIEKKEDGSWSQGELSAGLNAISRYLGDERKGSLYDNLIKKKLITSLGSGSEYWPESKLATLGVTMSLTDEGFENVASIISEFVHCLRFLKKKSPPSSFFAEIETMDNNTFLEQERQSTNLVNYLSDSILRGFEWKKTLFQPYDASTPDVFSWWSSQISLEPKLLAAVLRIDSDEVFKTDEKWNALEYHPGSYYSSGSISLLDHTGLDFHYPERTLPLSDDKKNEPIQQATFVPTVKLNEIVKKNKWTPITSGEHTFPMKNSSDVLQELVRLWGKFKPISREQDQGFEMVHQAGPVLEMKRKDKLKIDWLSSDNSISSQVLRDLIASWLNWRLHDELYDATMIGDHVKFYANSKGYGMYLDGSPSGMMNAHQQIFDVLNHFQKEDFDDFIDHIAYFEDVLKKKYLSEKNRDITRHMIKILRKMTKENVFFPEEKISALESLSSYFQSDIADKEKKEKLLNSVGDRYVLAFLMSPYRCTELKEVIRKSYWSAQSKTINPPSNCQWIPKIGESMTLLRKGASNGNLQMRRLPFNDNKSGVGLDILRMSSAAHYFTRLRSELGLSYVASLYPSVQMNQPILVNILGDSQELAERLSSEAKTFFLQEQNRIYNVFPKYRPLYRKKLINSDVNLTKVFFSEFERFFYPETYISDSDRLVALDAMTDDDWKVLVENAMGEQGSRGFLEIKMSTLEKNEEITESEIQSFRSKSDRFCVFPGSSLKAEAD